MNAKTTANFVERMTDVLILSGTLTGERHEIRAFVDAVVHEGDLSPWDDLAAGSLVVASIRLDLEATQRGDDPFAWWEDRLAGKPQ